MITGRARPVTEGRSSRNALHRDFRRIPVLGNGAGGARLPQSPYVAIWTLPGGPTIEESRNFGSG
jgi:hypothetical protein